MKKLIALLMTAIIFLISLSTIATAEPSDTEYSLTLQYSDREKGIEGLEIGIYRVAELSEGSYKAAGFFKELAVDMTNVKSQGEWTDICATFSAYAVAENIPVSYRAVTDENGNAYFPEIEKGLYMTMSLKAELNEGILVFESFLTAVPGISEEGAELKDVTAKPKHQWIEPTEDELEYKVVKQWRDNGYTAKRPEYIDVDIYKDNKLITTKRLSSSNNWSYSFLSPNDGALWQAVEREVPSGYSVTLSRSGNTIIITNSYDNGYEEPPQTGDTQNILLWIIAMSFSGVVFVVLAIFSKKKQS